MLLAVKDANIDQVKLVNPEEFPKIKLAHLFIKQPNQKSIIKIKT